MDQIKEGKMDSEINTQKRMIQTKARERNLVDEKDPMLREVCLPVPEEDFNDDLEYFCLELFKTMNKNSGYGLAAPQIGDNRKIFTMKDGKESFICINPQIEEYSESTVSIKEGCLSFPDLFLYIRRPEAIVVRYYNGWGNECTHELEGILARCFQHELDHLNGILFTDYVGKTKLKLAKNKRRKHK